jgi:hypothetical protein
MGPPAAPNLLSRPSARFHRSDTVADFKLLPLALLLLASPAGCQAIFPLDRYMDGVDGAPPGSSPEDDAALAMGPTAPAGSDAGASGSVADAAVDPDLLDGALEDSPSDASSVPGVGAGDGAPSEVVYRAESSVRSTTATLTVTIPATVASGDFLWITLYADGPVTTVTTPAGWIREGTMSDPTNEFGVWWYYRFAVANEATTAAFTIDTNGVANDPLIDVPPLGVASLVAFSGVDHTSPIQSENAALVTGSPFTSTSMGTPNPGILLVTSFVNDDADAAAVWTPSPPLIGVVGKGNVFTGYAVEGDAGLGGTMTARCSEDGNGLVSVIALNPVGAKGTSKMGSLGTP